MKPIIPINSGDGNYSLRSLAAASRSLAFEVTFSPAVDVNSARGSASLTAALLSAIRVVTTVTCENCYME